MPKSENGGRPADGVEASEQAVVSRRNLLLGSAGLTLGALAAGTAQAQTQTVAAHAHTASIPVVIVTGSDISLDHVDRCRKRHERARARG